MTDTTETGFQTKGEQEELRQERLSFIFNTQLEFLKSHCGYRPGKVHIILGPTGGGKSTLVKTLLVDLVMQLENRNALLILTEERVKDFHSSMSDFPCQNLKWLKLRIKTEKEIYDGRNPEFFIQRLSEWIEKDQTKIVFYDNITTSKYYMDKIPEIQSIFAENLKDKLCQKFDIPFVLIAHTKPEVTVNHHKIIGPEDLRGCKSTSNLAEFLYTIQVIDVEKHRFQYLKGHKCRNYDYDPGFFLLGYNKQLRIFDRVEKRDFESFRLNFEERQRLDGKRKK